MKFPGMPAWLVSLSEEELLFMKQFVLQSGSLKELAKIYELSYPTIRIRVDRLIEKIRLGEELGTDEFTKLLHEMTLDESIAPSDARRLRDAYERSRGE